MEEKDEASLRNRVDVCCCCCSCWEGRDGFQKLLPPHSRKIDDPFLPTVEWPSNACSNWFEHTTGRSLDGYIDQFV